MEENNYAFDEPSKQDYKWSDFEDILMWDESRTRPKDKLTVQNQLGTKACTVFAANHIHNALNILEDERLNENREEIKSSDLRDLFCKERWYSDSGSSIQTIAKRFKNKSFIAWYVTLDWAWNKLIEQMKKSIDMCWFLSCGSSNCDWTKTKETGIYTLRTDGKFVWHAWDYVWYGKDFFWAINSYGKERWPFGWYFKVPFELVDKTYSKLAFIDYDDHLKFATITEKQKALQIISLAKELYLLWNNDVKKRFENIKLSDNLKNLYKL